MSLSSGPQPISMKEAARLTRMVDWWFEGLPRAAHREPYLEHEGRLLTPRALRREMLRDTPLGRSFRQGFLEPYYARRPRTYTVRRRGETVESPVPGIYGGWSKGGIYGRLDCGSGKRMHPENRVFFLTLQDAVEDGYRPCGSCHPERGPFRHA